MAKAVAFVLLVGPVPTAWLIGGLTGGIADSESFGRTILGFAAATAVLLVIAALVPTTWIGRGAGVRKRVYLALIWFHLLYVVIGTTSLMEG